MSSSSALSAAEIRSIQSAVAQARANGATSYTRKFRSTAVAQSAQELYPLSATTIVGLFSGEAIMVIDLGVGEEDEFDMALNCMKCTVKTVHIVNKDTSIAKCDACGRRQRLDDTFVQRMWAVLGPPVRPQ
jgi:hypothetical protein